MPIIVSDPFASSSDPNSRSEKYLSSETKDGLRIKIESKLSQRKNFKHIQTVYLRQGKKSERLAVLYEIVNESDEFKHFYIDLFAVKYDRPLFSTDYDEKFTLTNDYNELSALYQLLKTFVDRKEAAREGSFLLMDTEDFNNMRLSVEDILEDPDGHEEIFNQGGIDFIKSMITFYKENGKYSEIIESLVTVGFSDLQEGDKNLLVENMSHVGFTGKDMNLLLGRKRNLETFKEKLNAQEDIWNEKEWQVFFENNNWIFGYGLCYKYLKILQREAAVSGVEVSGQGTVNADYLLADDHFTVLVELKKPETDLFDTNINRSGSWRLSKDLTYAVSQILEQKAAWIIKSNTQGDGLYTDEDELIEQKTYDPKAILVIGCSSQFSGKDKTSRIKAKTFELYRRNLKDIEIVTYDELYKRAKYIVENAEK